MAKYSIFRKYLIEADDKVAARKIWQGVAAEGNEEDFLEFEGMPKEVEEKSFGQAVKEQIMGK